MYLSHPVRRIREDPIAGESVSLVIESDPETETAEIVDALEELDIDVEQQLQFGAIRVTVEQETVDRVCEFDGITSIETAAVLGTGGDAGEDV